MMPTQKSCRDKRLATRFRWPRQVRVKSNSEKILGGAECDRGAIEMARCATTRNDRAVLGRIVLNHGHVVDDSAAARDEAFPAANAEHERVAAGEAGRRGVGIGAALMQLQGAAGGRLRQVKPPESRDPAGAIISIAGPALLDLSVTVPGAFAGEMKIDEIDAGRVQRRLPGEQQACAQ